MQTSLQIATSTRSIGRNTGTAKSTVQLFLKEKLLLHPFKLRICKKKY